MTDTYKMLLKEMIDRAPKLTTEERRKAIYFLKEDMPGAHTDVDFMFMPDSLIFILNEMANGYKLLADLPR